MPGTAGSTVLRRPSIPAMGRQLACVVVMGTALAGCADEPVSPYPIDACGPDALGVSRVIELSPASPPLEDQLGEHEVALTFDDGPERRRTPKVLEALAAECVRATFFLQGEHAEAQPDLTRAIALSGHEVGSHGWAHVGLTDVSLDEARANIQRSLDAINTALAASAETSDQNATLFRFTYLASSPALDALVEDLELISVSADIDSEDWDTTNTRTIVSTVMDKLAQNNHRGVILLHDPFRNSARTVSTLIRRLKADGYSVVAVRAGRDTAVSAEQQAEASHAVR